MTLVDKTVGSLPVKVALLNDGQAAAASAGERLTWIETQARLILATVCDADGVILFAHLADVYALPLPLFTVFEDVVGAALGSNPYGVDTAPPIAGAADIRAYVAAALAQDPLIAFAGWKIKRWTAGKYDARLHEWANDNRDHWALAIKELMYAGDGTPLFGTHEAVLALSCADVNSYRQDIVYVNGRYTSNVYI